MGRHNNYTALVNTINNNLNSNYYSTMQNPFNGKNYKFNVDNVWNPVDTYIYGPTSNTIFNQNDKIDMLPSANQKFQKFTNNMLNSKYQPNPAENSSGYKDKDRSDKQNHIDGNSGKKTKNSSTRKLIGEFFDNEAPKLCDHTALEASDMRTRPCSPLESYVSLGKDMVS